MARFDPKSIYKKLEGPKPKRTYKDYLGVALFILVFTGLVIGGVFWQDYHTQQRHRAACLADKQAEAKAVSKDLAAGRPNAAMAAKEMYGALEAKDCK